MTRAEARWEIKCTLGYMRLAYIHAAYAWLCLMTFRWTGIDEKCNADLAAFEARMEAMRPSPSVR